MVDWVYGMGEGQKSGVAPRFLADTESVGGRVFLLMGE